MGKQPKSKKRQSSKLSKRKKRRKRMVVDQKSSIETPRLRPVLKMVMKPMKEVRVLLKRMAPDNLLVEVFQRARRKRIRRTKSEEEYILLRVTIKT